MVRLDHGGWFQPTVDCRCPVKPGELRRFHEYPRSGIAIGSKAFLIIRLHEIDDCPRVDLLMDGNVETDWLYDFVEDNSETLSG